jgi:hypothetical protein
MKKRVKSIFALSAGLLGIAALGWSVNASSGRTPGEEFSTVTLAVIVLPTSNGAGMSVETYPKTIRVNGAAPFSERIAAYGLANRVWIAPKDWTGSAEVGADGSTLVKLFPLNGSQKSGPRFRYSDTGGCAGCALGEAAPYFPNAMREWKKSFGYETAEVLPPGIKLVPVSSTLVMYLLPDKGGLLGRGVAYCQPPSRFHFAKAEFVLPRADAKLSKFLIRTLVGQQKWR